MMGGSSSPDVYPWGVGRRPPPSGEGVVIAISWRLTSNVFFLCSIILIFTFYNFLFKDNFKFVRIH
jgi:hypothetical protein